MAKYTEGPWEVEDDPSGIIIEIYDSACLLKARCAGPDRQANARLIAAAPEMLETLKSDLEIFEQVKLRIEIEIKEHGEDAIFPCRAMLGSINDRIHVARAAIAKAEGE